MPTDKNKEIIIDGRLAAAVHYYGEHWPKDLTIEVMFFGGLRITRKDFNRFKREETC